MKTAADCIIDAKCFPHRARFVSLTLRLFRMKNGHSKYSSNGIIPRNTHGEILLAWQQRVSHDSRTSDKKVKLISNGTKTSCSVANGQMYRSKTDILRSRLAFFISLGSYVVSRWIVLSGHRGREPLPANWMPWFLSYCCKLFITTLLHRPNIPLSPCTALGLRSGPPILDHQARLVFSMETFTHNPLRRRGVASHALGTVGFSRRVRSRGESHCVIVIVGTIVLGGCGL